MRNVFMLSGPSAVGKTTLWERYKRENPEGLIEKVITTTSRPIRPGELHGRDYYFVSQEEFEEKIRSHECIEHALVHGNYYGSTKTELERIVSSGSAALYIIDPQGMVHLKPLLFELAYNTKSIFIEPPSLEELKKRLLDRSAGHSSEELELRYANALIEMESRHLYDIRLVNHTIEASIEELARIFEAYAL